MDVDYRGRIWITEAVNYRNYRNNDSFFLHRQKGDRVIILEDSNKDGVADTSKVFVQDTSLVSPLGIAVLGNKVYISCAPNLIVYTDDNGDDVPDKKEIFLTGFGGKDHDHSLHAVYGGADGNLYFNTGNAGPHIVTDKSGWTLRSGSMYTGGSPYNEKNEGAMKSDDGKVWTGGLALRISPEGKNLKVLGHNFRNSYEVIPDSYGNLWQNDNDDEVLACRTSWLMEGGNAGYFSQDGTRNWKADQRPGQEIPVAHWHQEDPGVMPVGDITGAGAPTGVTVIEGDELGSQYRGMLLSADAGRNIIFGYHPKVDHSGFDLGKRENFISSLDNTNEDYVWNDSTLKLQQNKWFRPSDVTIGTDGAIYVADWYDPVVGGHLMQDSSGFGRIYRISRKDKKMVTPVIDLSTIDGQIEALKNPAINVRYAAVQKLKQQGESATAAIKKLLEDHNPYVQARAIWLLPVNELDKILSHKDELLRATAYRALRQKVSDILPYAEKMVNDPSDFVRREVAVSLTDVAYDKKKALLIKLIEKDNDNWMFQTIATALDKHEAEIYPAIKSNYKDKVDEYAWLLHPVNAIDDLNRVAADSTSTTEKRVKALTGLGFVKDKKSVSAIKRLTTSSDTMVAISAKFWLEFLSPGSVKQEEVTLPVALTNISGDEKKYNVENIVAMKPDNRSGEQIFASHCRACHKAGKEGSTVAPNLTYITRKFDDKQLLNAIIFPSASIAFGYESWLVETKSKNSYYGFIISDNKESKIIRDIAGQNHTIKKSEIVSSKKQDKSIMPSAGQMNLSEQQLADVVGYLKGVAK